MADQLIPNILLVISAIEIIVFAFSYGWFFNYRKTASGRALMSFVVALIVLFIINTTGVFVGAHFANGDYPGRLILRTIGYGYVVYSLGYLNYVLWSNWHSGKPANVLVEAKERKKDK